MCEKTVHFKCEKKGCEKQKKAWETKIIAQQIILRDGGCNF